MIRILSIVIVFSHFLHAASYSREERLWCYECNTNLKEGRKGDCNDPFMPNSFDLTACSRNESHHCLKSIILYKSILVTVRACVPLREVNSYCNHEDDFQHSSIECYFCKENACNDARSLDYSTSKLNLGLFVIVLSSVLT